MSHKIHFLCQENPAFPLSSRNHALLLSFFLRGLFLCTTLGCTPNALQMAISFGDFEGAWPCDCDGVRFELGRLSQLVGGSNTARFNLVTV